MGTTLKIRSVSRTLMVLGVVLHLCSLLKAQTVTVGNKIVTVSGKDMTLESVFNSIKNQTGLSFQFDDSNFNAKEKVSANFFKKSLDNVLVSLLGTKGVAWNYQGNTILVGRKKKQNLTTDSDSSKVPSMTTVSGRVTAQNGDPLPGATILIKETNQAVAAKEEGEFRIENMPMSSIISVSYVGYETREIKVNKQSSLSIKLQPIVAEMNAVSVVSTGYQKIPKERATGSFTQIDNKLFNQQVTTDVISRLSYIANGLTTFPQRVAAVKGPVIRGLSTMTTTIAKPLIVVDNFAYEGDINNINPNDVENITILKDAAAASIWGARAGNGVIVITTKKGRFNQQTKVELTSNITIGEKPNLFALRNISTSDYIDFEQFLFSKEYNFQDTISPYHQGFSPVYEILFKQKSGLITSEEATSQINNLRSRDVRNEFNKYFYQKPLKQQYAINLRGGSDNLAWYLSGGFDKNISELNGKYSRLNVHLDNTYKLAKNLEVNTTLYFTQTKSSVGRPGYGSIGQSSFFRQGFTLPYSRFADEKGNPLPLYHMAYREGYIDTLGGGKLLDWKYYPLDDYRHIDNSTTVQDLNVALGLNYKISNSLRIEAKYRYQKQQSEIRNLQSQSSYFTRDLINSFSQLDQNTGDVTYKIPKGDILDLTNSTLTAQDILGQLNFNKSWSKHNVDAIIGGQISEQSTKGNKFRSYGYNSEILTSGNVDYINTYPHFITGFPLFVPNLTDFNKTVNRFVSLYANGAYTYDNKYTFSASARRDASNLFGVATNNKWKPLWSTGISWNLSNESFYKISFLPYLKLRATYGYQGNVDATMVGLTTLAYSSINPYTLTPFSFVLNYHNPNLRWETVGMLNVGLDFSTVGNKISGSFEIFQKKTNDLYGFAPVDMTVGLQFPEVKRNVATTKGHGIDIAINTVNIDRSIKWTSNAIINIYKDKVIKSGLPPSSIASSTLVSGGLVRLDGYPLLSLFAYKWAGLDPTTGDPQGYLNGKVSKDYSAITSDGTKVSDLVYVGSLIPTVYGSLGNTVSWKNISLTARITYKFGYYFRRESINYSDLPNSPNGHSDFSKGWKNPGDEMFTDVPSMVYPFDGNRDRFYNFSEVLIAKGDHIRLQYVNLSYNLAKDTFKKLPFEYLQLYAVINNLGIIWRANKEGLDPDYDNLTIPPSKDITLGLKIGF